MGASFNSYWDALPYECGDTVQVGGNRHTYIPWKNFKEVIPDINDEFDASRSRVRWSASPTGGRSRYVPSADRIELTGETHDSKWTAAHEYVHALHAESLGGLWDAGTVCASHVWDEPSNYRCAFQEGVADYGAEVAVPTGLGLESYDEADDDEVRAEFEGHVAAFFMDLFDNTPSETDDETYYSGTYIMKVFETCRVTILYDDGTRQTFDRNDVTDFVWCLENRVNAQVHEDHFPGTLAPESVYESATEPQPPAWTADKIRRAWILSVG